jgi:hypothetical protein
MEGASQRQEQPRNLPRFNRRDLIGIVVAIVGTIVLFILAANCHDPNIHAEEQGDAFVQIAGGCAIRFVLAVAALLLNLAHVVGIVLFESVGYDGPFARLFARLSLIGTPAAVVASALIGPA